MSRNLGLTLVHLEEVAAYGHQLLRKAVVLEAELVGREFLEAQQIALVGHLRQLMGQQDLEAEGQVLWCSVRGLSPSMAVGAGQVLALQVRIHLMPIFPFMEAQAAGLAVDAIQSIHLLMGQSEERADHLRLEEPQEAEAQVVLAGRVILALVAEGVEAAVAMQVLQAMQVVMADSLAAEAVVAAAVQV